MDLLVPLFDSERHLVEVLLSQPEKIVSTEEALKKMHEWAKKKRNPQAARASVGSPISNLSRQSEKRKEIDAGVGQ